MTMMCQHICFIQIHGPGIVGSPLWCRPPKIMRTRGAHVDFYGIIIFASFCCKKYWIYLWAGSTKLNVWTYWNLHLLFNQPPGINYWTHSPKNRTEHDVFTSASLLLFWLHHICMWMNKLKSLYSYLKHKLSIHYLCLSYRGNYDETYCIISDCKPIKSIRLIIIPYIKITKQQEARRLNRALVWCSTAPTGCSSLAVCLQMWLNNNEIHHDMETAATSHGSTQLIKH